MIAESACCHCSHNGQGRYEMGKTASGDGSQRMTEPRELAAAAVAAGARAVERTTGAVADAVAHAKPRLRGWLHTVSSPVVLAAGVVLIVLAPTAPGRVAAIAYALTSFILFTTSAIYHRG